MATKEQLEKDIKEILALVCSTPKVPRIVIEIVSKIYKEDVENQEEELPF